MTTPQTTHTDRLITLISGVFLLAALVVAGTQVNIDLDFERPSTAPATASAQGGGGGANQNVGFQLNMQPKQVAIGNFESSDYEVETGQQFTLSWGTSNARQVAAFGDWGGSLSSAPGTHTQSITENTAGVYTYGLRAEGYGANPDTVTDDLTVEVVQPPEFDFSVSAANVNLNGVPGATASTNITLDSLYEYEGNVDLVIDSVTPANQNNDGNELIDFSFTNSSPFVPEGGSETVSLEMTVQQPIRTTEEYTVTILGTDTTGNAKPTTKDVDITINAEGFSPRTIEEF